jgi:hypothetical protein
VIEKRHAAPARKRNRNNGRSRLRNL